MWDQLPSPQCHCNISTKELQYENDSIFQPKNILIYLPHVLRELSRAFHFSWTGHHPRRVSPRQDGREEAGRDAVAASFLSLPSEKPPKAAWKEHWKTLALLKQ